MRKIQYKKVGDGYETIEAYVYYSQRYNRTITISLGFYSDGATCAPDLDTDAWWIHDHVCRFAIWDDGTPIDNWQASTILADILWHDGFRFRAKYWWAATWLIGGGQARDNGMFVAAAHTIEATI
jgi:hypothetical protein